MFSALRSPTSFSNKFTGGSLGNPRSPSQTRSESVPPSPTGSTASSGSYGSGGQADSVKVTIRCRPIVDWGRYAGGVWEVDEGGNRVRLEGAFAERYRKPATEFIFGMLTRMWLGGCKQTSKYPPACRQRTRGKRQQSPV